MSLMKPRIFWNFEDLPANMRDRKEVTKNQRTFARVVSIRAQDIVDSVNREALNSVEFEREMYFSWDGIKDLINSYCLLCEYSHALDLIKRKEEMEAHALELIEKEKV